MESITLPSIFILDYYVSKLIFETKRAFVRVSCLIHQFSVEKKERVLYSNNIEPNEYLNADDCKEELSHEVGYFLTENEVKNISFDVINTSIKIQQLYDANKKDKIGTSQGQVTNSFYKLGQLNML